MDSLIKLEDEGGEECDNGFQTSLRDFGMTRGGDLFNLNRIKPTVRLEGFGDIYRSIGILEVLVNGNNGALNCDSSGIECVDEFLFPFVILELRFGSS